MKGDHKRRKEQENWEFVLMAVRNGDQEAIQLINRNSQIIKRLDFLLKVCKGKRIQEIRGELKLMKRLIEEKENLFKTFGLDKKKPQIYIGSIRKASKKK